MAEGASVEKTPYIEDKLIPPLMTGILIMGFFKPYYWVDDHPIIPYFVEIMVDGSLDPSTM